MSALTIFAGDGPVLHDQLSSSGNTASLASVTMDASTEIIALTGCVWHPTVKTGTINIRKVHFLLGALTFNALSTIRCSLQSVSATAGPPYQPDGTQDQTYDFVGAGLTGSAWNSTGNLSADRAVDLSAYSIGDANSRWLAVVFEYSTFTASDSFLLQKMNGSAATEHLLGGSPMLYTGTWGISSAAAGIVALECDDGSFAFMEGCRPVSASSNVQIASNAAIRAAGLKFKFPIELTIDGIGLMVTVPNGADCSLVLYDSDGTTALSTINIDNDSVLGTAGRIAFSSIQPVTLTADTYYRLALVAGTTTANAVYCVDVNAVALMDGFVGGQNFHWTQRDSAGSWADTTTRRPVLMLRLGSVHDGAGGAGGGMIRHPGLNGGING